MSVPDPTTPNFTWTAFEFLAYAGEVLTRDGDVRSQIQPHQTLPGQHLSSWHTPVKYWLEMAMSVPRSNALTNKPDNVVRIFTQNQNEQKSNDRWSFWVSLSRLPMAPPFVGRRFVRCVDRGWGKLLCRNVYEDCRC